jgi:hypothetical protein
MSHDVLIDLQQRFPLDPSWSPVESYIDTVDIRGHVVHTAGLIVRKGSGQLVTASAAQLGFSPIERAYFELLERCAIVQALDSNRERFPSFLLDGTETLATCVREAFPCSSAPEVRQYARSNGVAAHISCQSAVRSAIRESVERDVILRSWYGGVRPRSLDPWLAMLPTTWNIDYDFKATLLGHDPIAPFGQYVVMIAGLPKNSEVPLVLGFGARENCEDALVAASTEAVQRLGFLWGEALPTEIPAFAPTPDFHLEMYLLPEAGLRIRRWIEGEHANQDNFRDSSRVREEWRLVDLTPQALRGSIHVIKALSPLRLPLTFGQPPETLSGRWHPEWSVHPIA